MRVCGCHQVFWGLIAGKSYAFCTHPLLCYFKILLKSHWTEICPTLWTIARQTPLSVGFFRQECWSRLPFPPPGDLLDPGIEFESSVSPALQADSLPAESSGKPSMLKCRYNLKSFSFKSGGTNIATYRPSPKTSFIWLINLLKKGISGQYGKTRGFFIKIHLQVFFRNLKIQPAWGHAPLATVCWPWVSPAPPPTSAELGYSPVNPRPPATLSPAFVIMLLLMFF